MRVMKVDPVNPEKEVLDKAVKILELGGLIIYPTETLYGLGANMTDLEAVKKVFDVKGRLHNKPLSVAFRDVEHAKKYAEFNKVAEKLARKFLPGPLTIVLKSKLPLGSMFGDNTITVRIPSNKVARELLARTKFPITATSANVSGNRDPIDARIAIDQIGEDVDLVIDSGECELGKPSTVIDLSGDEIVFIREGAITKDQITSSL